MELIDRVNGFGKVMLTVPEQRMLREIGDIASTAGESYILGEINEPTGRYERSMRNLFPMVPLTKSAGPGQLSHNAYHLQRNESHHWYMDLPEAPSLQIGSRIVIGSEVKEVSLQVLMPSNADQEGYFMSVVVGTYNPGCIDDLVAKLGEREKPAILRVQKIKMKLPLNPDYGIAEVPQLKTVLKLYERADDLLRHTEDTIKITSKELHTLRGDMLRHQNIAIRKLSAVEYQKALEALIHK